MHRRSIHGDHEKFVQTYLSAFPGMYFTGDRAMRDQDGYYWIQGRVDDVVNVAGHRISTAEIEAAVCRSEVCAEAAALGCPDEIKGQSVWVFCISRRPVHELDLAAVSAQLKAEVRTAIGPFATPSKVLMVDDLPKTRSGKIMRRILRKLLEGHDQDALGDLSTLSNPAIVPHIAALIDNARSIK